MLRINENSISFSSLRDLGRYRLIGGNRGNKVYRLLDDDKKDYIVKLVNMKRIDIGFYEALCGIKNDSYLLPFKLVYKNDVCCGYLGRYSSFPLFSELSFETRFDSLDSAYCKWWEDTLLLSETGLTIFDLASDNVLFDKMFQVVDFDEFSFCPQDLCKKRNLTAIQFVLLDTLCSKIRIPALNNDLDFDIWDRDVVLNYQYILSDYLGSKVESIGEARKLLSL